MYNDLQDEQTIILIGYSPMFHYNVKLYGGKVGDMPENLRNDDSFKNASFYLLNDVEDYDILAII